MAKSKQTNKHSSSDSGKPTFQQVFDHATADSNLRDNEYRVLVALRFFARDTSSCWPGNKKLGQKAGGKSPGSIQRILLELERKGFIRRHNDSRTGERVRIELIVPIGPTPASMDPTPNSVSPHLKNEVDPTPNSVSPHLKNEVDPTPNLSTELHTVSELDAENVYVGGTTTTERGSSSSVPTKKFSSLPQESKDKNQSVANVEADPETCSDAIARAGELFDDSPALRAAVVESCRDYGENEVIKALAIAERYVDRTGKTIPFSYVHGVLKNGRAKGGLTLSKSPEELKKLKAQRENEEFDRAIEEMEKRQLERLQAPSIVEDELVRKEHPDKIDCDEPNWMAEALKEELSGTSEGTPDQTDVLCTVKESADKFDASAVKVIPGPPIAPKKPAVRKPLATIETPKIPDVWGDYLNRLSSESRARFEALSDEKKKYFAAGYRVSGKFGPADQLELSKLLRPPTGDHARRPNP